LGLTGHHFKPFSVARDPDHNPFLICVTEVAVKNGPKPTRIEGESAVLEQSGMVHGVLTLDAGRTARTAMLCAVIAAIVAALTHVLGPPAADAPAHAFQTLSFVRHGFALWDNYWYAGSYQYVLYRALYYPVAAVGGIVPVAVVSASFAGWAFASAAGRRWGMPARLPSLAFAATAPIIVMVSGMYPFGAGLAAAGISVVLLQRRHTIAAAIAIIVVAGFSPLAFLLLLVVLTAALLASGAIAETLSGNRVPALAVGGALIAAVALKLFFVQPGYYPFSKQDLATALGFSGAGLLLARGRGRRDFLTSLFVVYALTNLALFLVSSPIGANAMRLYSVAALPLLWLASRTRPNPVRLRWSALILIVAFSAQVAPYVASSYRSFESAAAAGSGFWRPAISFLKNRPDNNYRVEVVATAGHWEAYYLARAGVSLARGWYRQSDYPENTLLYQPTITPSAYRSWLRKLGIQYVLLPDVPLDYSSQAEATLIRSGRSGLVLAGTAPHWQFYRLPDPVGIVSGGRATPQNVHVTAAGISFAAQAAGSYLIRVRYNPYWQTSTPICISPAANDMMRLQIQNPAVVRISMPDPITAILGDTDSACHPNPL
jgi:hypothetical protein